MVVSVVNRHHGRRREQQTPFSSPAPRSWPGFWGDRALLKRFVRQKVAEDLKGFWTGSRFGVSVGELKGGKPFAVGPSFAKD